MFAIETELGRFEADTEKDAKKLLRKAQLEAKRKYDETMELWRKACLFAESNAYKIYSRFHSGSFPAAWSIHSVNESGSGTTIKNACATIWQNGEFHSITTLQDMPTHTLCNGCGDVIALYFGSGDLFYAVGCEGAEYSICQVNGISWNAIKTFVS